VKQRLRRIPGLGPVLDVQERVADIDGGMLASAVTLSLFLSLFPVLLVTIAVVGFVSSGDSAFADDLVSNLGLTGSAADFILEGVRSAQRSKGATSIIGFLGLVWATLGVIGSIQSVCDRAWQVEGRGVKDKLVALGWLAGSLVLLGAALTLAGLLPALPGWAAPLQIVAGVVCAIAFFWFTFRVLVAVPLGWRPHLPGAVLGGVGFHALTIAAAVIVPRQAASSSALYGSIGVVLALLGWLLLFGRLLVYSVVLNVLRYEAAHGTVHVEVEAPRFDGQVPTRANRSAVVQRESVRSA
jgi:membrane protein